MKPFIRQLLKCVLLLFVVSIVAFVLVGLSPVDPVQANVGQAAYTSMSEAKRAQLASYWGADVPIWQRYVNWIAGVFTGDFGTSLRYNQPVLTVLAERSANTLLLMTIAWLISGVLGFIMGVVAGVFQGRLADKVIRIYSFVLASTPAFWLGLLMLVVFSVWLGIFPLGFSAPIGKAAADVTLLDALHHVALPALTLSIIGVANIALHTREKVIDIMNSSYVRFARMRGESERSIVLHHVLRNAALPTLTLQFASIAEIFGGSVLVEQVFSYPGLGQAAVTAGVGGDAPLLVGIAIVSALIVFVGNLAANILYQVVDPRIRAGEEETIVKDWVNE